jgi:zinc protease
MRLSRPLIAAVILGHGLALGAEGPPPNPGWAQEHSDVAVSPRVTFGRLENGFRYALVPDRTPPGQVSLRLLVLVGSLYERDDELGYAHFVEHLAFRSTRSFHADEKVRFLQGLGVSFGPHINAETTFAHTLYKLDLPVNSPDVVASALRILRDFADGVAFEPSEIDQERGVVLSEALSGHTPDHDREAARFNFIYGGTRIPRRWPIGSEASIKGARAKGLRAFYDAWYRPERIVLVVAGDLDPAAVAPLVRSSFSGLAARGPRRPAPALDGLALPDKVSARFFSEARNGVQVELGTVRADPPAPDSEKSRLYELSLEMATNMLGRRLRHLMAEPAKPFSAYSVGNERPFGQLRQLSVVVVGDDTKWSSVVAVAEQELRRAMEYGFDDTELSVERESMRNQVRESAQSVATAPPATLAQALVESVEQGNVFALPDERVARVLDNVGRASAESCRSALREAWGAYPRYLFVTAHAHLLKLGPGQILDAYRASAAAAVAPPDAVKAVGFAYDFGPAGEVIHQEYVADPDLWLIRFANGVRLNLKRTGFERRFVRMNVRFGTGRLEEPADKPGLLVWAGAAMSCGGLLRYTDDELDRALGGAHFDVSIGTASDAFQIIASSSLDQFPLLIRRLTANLTDAAFRPEQGARLSEFRNDVYLGLETSADGAITQHVNPFLAGGDVRLGIPPRETARGYSMDVLAAALRPVLQSGCIEVALVGDFDVEAMIAEVARTFGALPPRAARPEPGGREKLRFPVPPQKRTYTYATSTRDRPTTLVFCWPVNEPIPLDERHRLELLAYVLQDRLRVQIRVEKGETYFPTAGFNCDEAYPGYARLSCQLDVKGPRARQVGQAVGELAVNLGLGGVTADELARAKAQRLADVRRRRTENAYWLSSVLADAQERPWKIDEARGLESEVLETSLAQVNAAAARYLAEKNVFQFDIVPVYSTGITLFDRLK